MNDNETVLEADETDQAQALFDVEALAANQLIGLLDSAGYEVKVESVGELIADVVELLDSGALSEDTAEAVETQLNQVYHLSNLAEAKKDDVERAQAYRKITLHPPEKTKKGAASSPDKKAPKGFVSPHYKTHGFDAKELRKVRAHLGKMNLDTSKPHVVKMDADELGIPHKETALIGPSSGHSAVKAAHSGWRRDAKNARMDYPERLVKSSKPKTSVMHAVLAPEKDSKGKLTGKHRLITAFAGGNAPPFPPKDRKPVPGHHALGTQAQVDAAHEFWKDHALAVDDESHIYRHDVAPDKKQSELPKREDTDSNTRLAVTESLALIRQVLSKS